MKRRLVLASGMCVSIFALTQAGYAQTETTVVREAVPEQRSVIVANSAEDMALREEIRKIRAYNAYVNSQIGISADQTVYEAVPVKAKSGMKIELFEIPTTEISYVSNAGTVRKTVAVTTLHTDGMDMSTASHRVVQGETLYGLARANCISVSDIQNKNGFKDSGIQLGQVIALPASQCEASMIAVTAETAPVEMPEVKQITRQSRTQTEYVRKVMPVPTSIAIDTTHNYAVLPKDTLYSIGRQYCVKAKDLAAHNGIETGKAIQPGQILRVPPTACVK